MRQMAQKIGEAPTSKRDVRPFRLAILGGGAVTSVYYIPAARACPEMEIVAVIDPSPRALAEVRATGSNAKLIAQNAQDFLSEAKMLTDLALDGVVVAVPNFLHEATVCLALEKGLHVLCEKPLALTELSCRKIGALAKKTGKTVAVGMVRRLTPAVALAQSLLHKGVLGELEEVLMEDGGPYGWTSDSGVFFDPRSGGVLADMGVHYLDILQTLLGELRPVRYADDYRGGCEADLTYDLQAAKKVPVRLSLSRYRTLGNSLLLRGTLATLCIPRGVFDRVFLEWPDNKQSCLRAEVAESNPAPLSSAADLTPYFSRQFNEFVSRIRDERSPLATVQQATRTTALIEWAYTHRSRLPVRQVTSGPRLEPGSVTITGASGFIGTHLVERLAAQGHAITAPVRNYRTCAELARFPVALPRVDLLNRDEVVKSVGQSRFVFHLAYGRDGANGARITIEGTKQVVEAAIAAGAECVVVLSTMYVFGRQDGSTINEESPYHPAGGEYGRSKAKMEQWCLERSKTSGRTRIVVLNPSFVYGPGGKTFSVLPVRLAQENSFCWVEGGRGTANYVYIDNLIDAMLLAATCLPAHGHRILINDGDCSWKEFLNPVLRELGRQIPNLSGPELRKLNRDAQPSLLALARVLLRNQDFRNLIKRLPGVRLAAKAAKSLLPPRKGQPPAFSPAPTATAAPAGIPPVWLIDLFSKDRVTVENHKARQLLGWFPAVSLVEGQKRTREWLEAHGEFRKRPPSRG